MLVLDARATTSANSEETHSNAAVFGKVPQVWGARLSPDGSRTSFLHMHEADMPVALVLSEDGEVQMIAASVRNRFDITWCRWANTERLLCGYSGIDNSRGQLIPVTRMIAVDHDGGNQLVLLQDRLAGHTTQFQDDVVDWLPDDPEHVLMELPEDDGTGVGRVNIYSGKVKKLARGSDYTREWRSDGHGQLRLRHYVSRKTSRWRYRLADEDKWRLLREWDVEEINVDYYPVGFAADRNTLMVVKRHEGRLALWAEDLTGQRSDQLIFSHDAVDVGFPFSLGKYDRIVAIAYSTDRSHFYFFDQELERIVETIAAARPNSNITVVDESWDKRYYLVHVSSDRDAGQYFRYDKAENQLKSMYSARPALKGRTLGAMVPVEYPATDGAFIPGYLSLPPDGVERQLPAVILPHGGPESRDYWDFDWLVQFFAAEGFVVLQMNYRGSGGFGAEWAGEGGFRAWERAIEDINDGTRWLIEQGSVDPGRICIVGWSYGGYAALTSAVVEPDMYKCVVSIAGVTDPITLIQDYRYFVSSRAVREFVGTDQQVLRTSSPLRRADEIKAPVLMFHGDRDINVNIKHSKKMNKALRKAGKSTDLIVYEDVAHGIWRDEYRVDMLTRIGEFLHQHTGSP